MEQTMHDENTVQRFIALRVQGRPFARIAEEINVSVPTLVSWSRKHQHTIANHATHPSVTGGVVGDR